MSRLVRNTLAIAASVLVGGAVIAAAIGFGGNDSAPPATTTGLPPATAPVTRATLTQTQLVSGTLGYGTPVTVTAPGPGRITLLPVLGAIVSRGEAVYRTDNLAVPLFYGSLPLYRRLRAGDSGEDVEEVEQNLAALGYPGLTVDAKFTSATASAVRKWQTDLGLPSTGIFEPASVVIAVAPVRIASLAAHLGDPASGHILAYTGTTRAVAVALNVTLQGLVKPGQAATITLPDGKTVDGTVATVGSVAVPGAREGDPATIDVTVAISDQSSLGLLDQAPVSVTLVSATVENVLTVPVAALVALAEGGFGVQVVIGSTSHYVAVQLGMFANGRVQISGDSVTEGMLVGVPA
jgi:peptidoglycan hydrolase-like protein with peptidoglycan-binding domain